MKIALVSPYDWSYPGGVREHVRHLADQFIRSGQDVRILAPASGAGGRLVEDHVYKLGGTTAFPINGSLARISLSPSLGKHVYGVLQQEKFDVVHLHEPLIPGLNLTVLRYSRTLNVGTFHAFAQAGMTSTPYLAYASAHPFLRPYFRRLAGRIAVSTVAQDFASHYFPSNYRVIPNGINLERFSPTIEPLPNLMDGKKNILFVGRFEKRKGAKYLIRAIPRVRERHPDTRFIFVGEGSLRAGFQHFVEKQGWHDVLFTGYVSDEDLPRYFASADAFCAPATGGESMGIILLEAMAAGIPVVASDIAGYSTVVSHAVNGLLATPRDSEALANALSQILQYESLRQNLIRVGLQRSKQYAWPQLAQSILAYYQELLLERKEHARLTYNMGII